MSFTVASHLTLRDSSMVFAIRILPEWSHSPCPVIQIDKSFPACTACPHPYYQCDCLFLTRSSMPKEWVYFGEQVSSGTSKKAKDRSNSATLRASQNDPYRDKIGWRISERMFTFDSEKDSGYSGELFLIITVFIK